MIHCSVANIVPACERRNDKVRHTETELRAKALMSCGSGVSRMRSRTGWTQVAMVGINAGRRRLALDQVKVFTAVLFGLGDFRMPTEDRPPPR